MGVHTYGFFCRVSCYRLCLVFSPSSEVSAMHTGHLTSGPCTIQQIKYYLLLVRKYLRTGINSMLVQVAEFCCHIHSNHHPSYSCCVRQYSMTKCPAYCLEKHQNLSRFSCTLRKTWLDYVYTCLRPMCTSIYLFGISRTVVIFIGMHKINVQCIPTWLL